MPDAQIHERIFEEDQDEKSLIVEEVYQTLMGQRANLIDQMVHDLYDEDARISGLERDLPEAVVKASASDNGNGPSKLAMSMRRSVSESLQLIAETDKSYLIRLLSPVIGAATSQYFVDTTRHLIEQANKRLLILLSPKTLGWYFQSLVSNRTFSEIIIENTTGYRVNSIYTCEKSKFEPICQIDHSKEIRSLSIIRDYKSKDYQLVHAHLNEQKSLNKTLNNVGLSLSQNKAAVIYEGTSQVSIGIVEGNISHEFISLLQSISEEIDSKFGRNISIIDNQPDLLDHEIEDLTEGMRDTLTRGLIEKKPKVNHNTRSCPKIALLPFAVPLLALILWQGFSELKWKRFVSDLDQTPGLTITQIDTKWGKRSIRGIKDPNTVDPASIAAKHDFGADKIDLHFATFLSGANQFSSPRAEQIDTTIKQSLSKSQSDIEAQLQSIQNSISPAIAVSLEVNEKQQQEVTGSIQNQLSRLSNSIDANREQTSTLTSEIVAQAIASHEKKMIDKSVKSLRHLLDLPDRVSLVPDNGTLKISGELPHSDYLKVIELGAFVYSIEAVDSSGLTNQTLEKLSQLTKSLEKIRVPFYSGTSNPEPESEELIQKCAERYSELKQLAGETRQALALTPRAIPLVGTKDEANKLIVGKRWSYLKEQLIAQGIKESEITDLQWDQESAEVSEDNRGLYLSVDLK